MLRETGEVFFYKIVIAGIKLLIFYILAKFLSVELYGVYSFLIALILFSASLGNLGLEYSNTYYISTNKDAYSKIVSMSLLFSLFSGIILFFSILMIWFLINKPFSDINIYLLIISSTCIFFILNKKSLNGIFVGLQNYTLYGINNLLEWVFFLLSLILLLFFKDFTIINVMKVYLISLCASNVIMLLSLRRVKEIRFLFSYDTLKEMVNYGYKVYFKNIFESTALRLDYFIIKYYLSTSLLGVYSIAVQSAEFLIYLPSAISLILFPKIASLDNHKSYNYYCRIFNRTISLMIIISIAAYFLYPFFIRSIFNEKYIDTIPLFSILLIGIVAFAGVRVNESYLLGIAKQKYILISSLIAGLLMIVLDVIFIPTYKIYGAAVISSFVYVVYFLFTLFFIKRINVKV